MITRARSSCRDAARLVVALVALSGPVHATEAPAAASSGPVQPLVVGVTVNGNLVADGQLLFRGDGAGARTVWLPLDQARAWRLDVAGRAQRRIDRQDYAGFCVGTDRCDLDEAGSLLSIQLPAAGFLPLRLGPAAVAPAAAAEAASAAAPTGAFLNYDFSTWRYGRPGMSGLLDGRVYSGFGHGAFRIGSVYAGERLTNTVGRAVWQIDQPEQQRSIQLGSIAIPDTALSAGLPLTGARIGSNALLQPLAPATLRPIVDGIADRSTRTDVFVDGQYRQTALIPYGRYSIELLPQFSGRGDIEVVSTDPSGAKTRLLIPYYQTPTMLAPGRNEWSLDAGLLGDDGSRRIDNARRTMVASAWLRSGVARWLTVQGQLLVGGRATRVAASADTVDTRWGASSIGATWQDSPLRGRQLWVSGGHEFVSRDFSASVRSEQLVGRCETGGESGGLLSDRLTRPCRHTSATLAASVGQRASVAAAADLLREADGRRSTAIGVNARWQLGSFSQVAASLQRVAFDHRGATVVAISYSRPLDGRYTGQSSVERRGDAGTALQWAAQRLPAVDGSDDGPRFQTYGAVGERRSELGARWAGEANHYAWRAETRVDRHGLSGAAGIDGSIGYAEGHVFTARRIDDAFIVVDAGLPGLPVMLDNRLVAHTDEDGLSIVTGARARQENSISVDVSSLPIRYAMPRDQLMVMPGIGAGALARFDLSDGGIAIEVRDARGERLPAGAAATVSSQTLATAVTSRSEVFIDRSDRAATIRIEWNGQRCVVAYQPGEAPPGGYRCGAR